MALNRRKAPTRREPTLDATPMSDQRPVSTDRSDAAEDTARPARKRRRKGSSRSRKRGPKRSGIRRVVYWGAVLGLWMLIAAVGVIGLVFASLPPIQSLEIPKRPPSIQIVSLDGHLFAMRGEGGPAIHLRDLPRAMPQAFVAIEDRRFYTTASIPSASRAPSHQRCAAVYRKAARPSPSNSPRTCSSPKSARSAGKCRKPCLRFGRAQAAQGRNHRALSQSRLLRRRRIRHRGGGTALLQQAGQAVVVGGGSVLAGLVRSPSRLAPSRNPNWRRAARPDRARRHGGSSNSSRRRQPRPRS